MRHSTGLSETSNYALGFPFKKLAATMLGAAALAGLPAAHAATGAVIDFESAPLGPIGSYDPAPGAGPTLNDLFISNGFYVGAFTNAPQGLTGDFVATVLDGNDIGSACFNLACPTGASNPSKYMATVNDGVIDIFHTDQNQTFSIKSFDASFIGNYDSGSFPALSGGIRIQGITADGGSITQDFGLDGPGADGFEFGHYVTTGAFANTEFVEVYMFGFACETSGSCSLFSTNRGQFGIDNIETTAPVPEPSTWMMLGAGLLAIGAAARRRRQA